MMIFGGLCFFLAAFFLPETYPKALLLKKAKRIRKNDPSSKVFAPSEKESFPGVGPFLHKTVLLPFIMLVKEPILLLISASLEAPALVPAVQS